MIRKGCLSSRSFVPLVFWCCGMSVSKYSFLVRRNYRPHMEYGGRYCFHRRVSFCSQEGRVHPQSHPLVEPLWMHSPPLLRCTSQIHSPGCTPPPRMYPICTPPWMHPSSPPMHRRSVRILLECILVFLVFEDDGNNVLENSDTILNF